MAVHPSWIVCHEVTWGPFTADRAATRLAAIVKLNRCKYPHTIVVSKAMPPSGREAADAARRAASIARVYTPPGRRS
jgi:hypothetical protein